MLSLLILTDRGIKVATIWKVFTAVVISPGIPENIEYTICALGKSLYSVWNISHYYLSGSLFSLQTFQEDLMVKGMRWSFFKPDSQLSSCSVLESQDSSVRKGLFPSTGGRNIFIFLTSKSDAFADSTAKKKKICLSLHSSLSATQLRTHSNRTREINISKQSDSQHQWHQWCSTQHDSMIRIAASPFSVVSEGKVASFQMQIVVWIWYLDSLMTENTFSILLSMSNEKVDSGIVLIIPNTQWQTTQWHNTVRRRRCMWIPTCISLWQSSCFSWKKHLNVTDERWYEHFCLHFPILQLGQHTSSGEEEPSSHIPGHPMTGRALGQTGWQWASARSWRKLFWSGWRAPRDWETTWSCT